MAATLPGTLGVPVTGYVSNAMRCGGLRAAVACGWREDATAARNTPQLRSRIVT